MNLRIVDFGLSNTYQKDEKLGTACGSPCYAAPEMLKGDTYEGLAVDIWSAGVILFARVCGHLPFEDTGNQVDLYRRIMTGEYNISVDLSESLCDLISKILNVNPHLRFSLEQIRRHPWMFPQGSQPSARGIVIGYNSIPIDFGILNSL
jgi:5'-AMP-activated protein kinase catalytic alpha subunit